MSTASVASMVAGVNLAAMEYLGYFKRTKGTSLITFADIISDELALADKAIEWNCPKDDRVLYNLVKVRTSFPIPENNKLWAGDILDCYMLCRRDIFVHKNIGKIVAYQDLGIADDVYDDICRGTKKLPNPIYEALSIALEFDTREAQLFFFNKIMKNSDARYKKNVASAWLANYSIPDFIAGRIPPEEFRFNS